MTRRGWRGAAVATAAAGLLAACTAPAPEPPVTTTISEPVVSVAPTPAGPTGPVAQVVDGFLPAASLGAADVDWGAVGPGWFLVSWQHERDRMVDTGSEFGLVPRASDGLTLVAPDGTAYAVASLEDADASRAIWWYGDTAAVLRVTAPGGGEVLGEVVTLDLATGASTLARAEGGAPGWRYLVDADRMIGATFGGESDIFLVYAGAAEAMELCPGGPTYVTALSPDGSAFVCFDGVDAGAGTHTRVRVADPASPGNARDVATFTRKPWLYEIAGWADDSTLVFGREDDGPNLVYFTFDVDSGDVGGFDMPTPGSPYATLIDSASGTYRIETTEWVTFFDAEGQTLAEVPCRQVLPRDRFVAMSGQRALVACRSGEEPAAVTVTLVDLDTGVQTPVASATAGATEAVRGVFGYDPRLAQ